MSDYLDKNAADEFRDILSHWINVYKWQNCSYVAVKSPTGPRLVFGRIILEPNSFKDSISDFYLETENIIAQHETLKIEPADIAERLLKAKEGLVTYSKHIFNLKNKSDELPYLTCYPIYHPAISYGPRLPSLIIREKERHAIFTMNLRLLDWELRSADQPFDSITDLLVSMGLPVLSQMGDFAAFELVARTPANISDKSLITNNSATIIVNVSQNVDINKIKLGCKVFNKNGIERFSVNGGKITWTNNQDSIIGEYKHTVEDAAWLQAFLSYEDLTLHDGYINDPQKQTNPRYSIHSIFDGSHDILKRFLLEAEFTQENFEEGIALLLNILGFSIFHYGQIPKLKDGPDIVAFTPLGNIAIIECTVGLLDNKDKLAKLIQRTVLVKDKLKNAGLGYFSIQPIIISRLSKAEVTGHLEEAGKHNIAVVCKEELEELFRRASFLPDAEGLFKEAERLIPKKDQLSLATLNKR